MGCNSSQPIDSFDVIENSKKEIPVHEVKVVEKIQEPSEKTTDLNSIEISSIKKFTFNGIITDGKVIGIKDGDTISVIMNINDKINIYNLRMHGYDADSASSRSKSTNGLRAKILLIKILTSCGDKINYKMRSKEINKIIETENKKIIKIHLMGFDKYDEIFAKIYIDDQNKFAHEIMIDSNLVHPYEENNSN